MRKKRIFYYGSSVCFLIGISVQASTPPRHATDGTFEHKVRMEAARGEAADKAAQAKKDKALKPKSLEEVKKSLKKPAPEVKGVKPRPVKPQGG